jgi:hypothetical protein
MQQKTPGFLRPGSVTTTLQFYRAFETLAVSQKSRDYFVGSL